MYLALSLSLSACVYFNGFTFNFKTEFTFLSVDFKSDEFFIFEKLNTPTNAMRWIEIEIPYIFVVSENR